MRPLTDRHAGRSPERRAWFGVKRPKRDTQAVNVDVDDVVTGPLHTDGLVHGYPRRIALSGARRCLGRGVTPGSSSGRRLEGVEDLLFELGHPGGAGSEAGLGLGSAGGPEDVAATQHTGPAP